MADGLKASAWRLMAAPWAPCKFSFFSSSALVCTARKKKISFFGFSAKGSRGEKKISGLEFRADNVFERKETCISYHDRRPLNRHYIEIPDILEDLEFLSITDT